MEEPYPTPARVHCPDGEVSVRMSLDIQIIFTYILYSVDTPVINLACPPHPYCSIFTNNGVTELDRVLEAIYSSLPRDIKVLCVNGPVSSFMVISPPWEGLPHQEPKSVL